MVVTRLFRFPIRNRDRAESIWPVCTTPKDIVRITETKPACRSSSFGHKVNLLDIFKRKPRAASTAELRAFFNEAASSEEHYPSTIDPRIFHVKLILDHLGDLNGKRVADVGCGKGR